MRFIETDVVRSMIPIDLIDLPCDRTGDGDFDDRFKGMSATMNRENVFFRKG